ncbi:MAG: SPOR domain-containing protein [Tannerellaceae bacterium]|nr:SPOR domain-containing protein [Tannerellaceae bacterium]
MKRCLYVICIVMLMSLTGAFGLSAQELNLERSTIFDALTATSPGKGEVIVNQPNAIKNMVGTRSSVSGSERGENVNYIKTQGYRVQVFSGNNQRSSKDEAFQKEKEVKQYFPEVHTYVSYNAPFWRLRVGDFSSHEQAYYLLRQLSDAFPKFGKEMYIVKEEVRVPIHQWDY